jgi:hypothetical protein
MACCPLPGGATRCKAQEVLKFEDKKEPAGREAPLAIQIHNKGIEDEYKDLVVESPVADPTKFLTTQRSPCPDAGPSAAPACCRGTGAGPRATRTG